MVKAKKRPEIIYREMMIEALYRLSSADNLIKNSNNFQDAVRVDSAILQIRKAMEAIAFSSIAPSEKRYEDSHRHNKKTIGDHYHARRIMASLAAINPDFYPTPLVPAIRQPDGGWNFGRKTTGYMTRTRFEKFYDRLGKYLHTINPWGKDPQIHQLCKDLPTAIDAIYELLDLHFAVIHIEEPATTQIWLVDAKRDGTVAMTIAMAEGSCVVQPS
ncbi:hypothetical protein [Aeromonas sp. 600948]|uniref:hypothetical protein n=1 Tax=Aeromonas sp. 600948 TaxID=2712034 RepID=UPI003BA16D92